jgi:ribosome-associated protein
MHDDDTIPLEGFLKREGVFPTGGQAKLAIQGGDVLVNGVVETRRKKKIKKGDVVNVGGQDFVVIDLD